MQNTFFLRRSGEFQAKRCCQHKIERNTVLEKELYSISEFDAKRIFKRKMVITWQNAILNPQCTETQFLRKSFIP